jgi:uncharacterized protein (DUF58 family)
MSKPTDRRVSICREGWVYFLVTLIVLAAAILRQINLLMAFFGMLAAVPLLSWRVVQASLKHLEVRRKLPECISAGDLLVVEIEAANGRRRLGSWALVVGDIVRRVGHDATKPLTPQVMFTSVPAGQSRRMTYRGRLPDRGKYAFGPLQVSTRFPLGLLRSSLTLPQTDTLLVFPRLGRLGPGWNRLQQSADVGSGRAARHQGLLAGDFYGLRDWRDGDSRRWIHWRTSARRQSVVVRQFERQKNQDLALVLDLWQPAVPLAAQLENVELTVSCGATILAELCHRGGRTVYLGAAADKPYCHHGMASNPLLNEMLTELAMVRAASADHLAEVLAQVLDRVRPGTRVVLISTRPIDLSDTQRFTNLWNNSRQRAWLGRIQCLDVSRGDLSDFYSPE